MESEFKAKLQNHSEILEHIVRENIKLKEQIEKKDAMDAELALKISEMQQSIQWLAEDKLPTDGKMRRIIVRGDERKFEIFD